MTGKQLSTTNHDRDSAALRYVYPVISRRAGGVSVGINLNPDNACNWRCIYCQVPDLSRGTAPAIDLAVLENELRGFLDELLHGDFMQTRVPEGARRINDIALSGNGEPTSSAEFAQVVELIARVRAEVALPEAVKTVLITNGSLLYRSEVRQGLRDMAKLNGEVWFKLDAGTAAGMARINGTRARPEIVARRLTCCADLAPTWIQTCLFRLDGDPPAAREFQAYLALLAPLAQKLAGVHLYSLARPSLQKEAPRLGRMNVGALEAVANRVRQLGLTVRVSP